MYCFTRIIYTNITNDVLRFRNTRVSSTYMSDIHERINVAWGRVFGYKDAHVSEDSVAFVFRL
jgi:hypothetical protein